MGRQYLQVQFRFTEPLDDVRVRQAINHAVNREQIRDVVLAGRGEVAWMPYPQSHIGYNPDVAEQYPYDPERARELLAEAGHGDGLTLEMYIPGGGIVNMERQGEIVQQQLADVGIDVTITRTTEIAVEYYLQKNGNMFSAARLPGTDPAGQLDDISELVTQARSTTDIDEAEAFIEEGVAIVVEEALEAPLVFQPRNIAWDTETVGGTLGAPASACDPIDLSDASMLAADGS